MKLFQYEFYPVGQGLFSYGILRRPDNWQKLFSWVYDCGSDTSVVRSRIANGIERIKAEQEPRGEGERVKSKIDLVFLSHFDKDHISGIKQLLGEFEVDTLVLPYMSFEQLILIAIEESIDGDDPIFPFFTDPVGYITGIEGAIIARILFVPPSGTVGPGPYTGEATPPTIPTGDVNYEEISSVMGPEESGWLQSSMTEVRLLNPGASITAHDYWEFVPYNDDPSKPIHVAFANAVIERRAALIESGNGAESVRVVAMKELQKVYDKHFGHTGEARNIISLFVYSGPLRLIPLEMLSCSSRGNGYAIHADASVVHLRWDRHGTYSYRKQSIIYTGDGYLDTHSRLVRMINYFDQVRVERCAVFQVMHHGSEGNWHKGVAESIAPCFSIFSSDPSRGKWQHPHAPVLRDFWSFGPIQVDKLRGYGVSFRAAFKP